MEDLSLRLFLFQVSACVILLRYRQVRDVGVRLKYFKFILCKTEEDLVKAKEDNLTVYEVYSIFAVIHLKVGLIVAAGLNVEANVQPDQHENSHSVFC